MSCVRFSRVSEVVARRKVVSLFFLASVVYGKEACLEPLKWMYPVPYPSISKSGKLLAGYGDVFSVDVVI